MNSDTITGDAVPLGQNVNAQLAITKLGKHRVVSSHETLTLPQKMSLEKTKFSAIKILPEYKNPHSGTVSCITGCCCSRPHLSMLLLPVMPEITCMLLTSPSKNQDFRHWLPISQCRCPKADVLSTSSHHVDATTRTSSAIDRKHHGTNQ